MKRKKSGLIPEKAQIPVAIGGLILLVLLVLYRFVLPRFRAEPVPPPAASASAPSEAAAAPAPGASGAAESANLVPGLAAMDDLQAVETLSAELQKQALNLPKTGAAPPPLAANPFSPFNAGASPEIPSPPGAEGDGATASGIFAQTQPVADETPPEPTQEELDRLDRLGSLHLTGTLQSGGWSMALINEGYYRPGEQVEGFTIAEIQEKQVTLRDQQGTEVLHLEASQFKPPAMTLPPRVPPPLPKEAPVVPAAPASEAGKPGEGAT